MYIHKQERCSWYPALSYFHLLLEDRNTMSPFLDGQTTLHSLDSAQNTVLFHHSVPGSVVHCLLSYGNHLSFPTVDTTACPEKDFHSHRSFPFPPDLRLPAIFRRPHPLPHSAQPHSQPLRPRALPPRKTAYVHPDR